MKKLVVLVCLCLIGTTSNSEQFFEYKKPITCTDFRFLISTLSNEEIGEKAIWIGSDQDSNSATAVMVNEKTLTWTVVQYNEKTGCILSSGTNFKYKINRENPL